MANGRVREYIGARYVPIFADPVTWDDERAYDPLTMVQYSGETYMSKQYVPTGAPLPTVAQGEESNEFWVHMSNWNAQVEAYREEVMRYAADVLEFDGRIDTLEADLPIADFDSVNTVKAAISTIENRFPVVTNDIASNAVTLNKLATSIVDNYNMLLNNELIVFGDSWTTTSKTWMNHYASSMRYSGWKTYGVTGAAFMTRQNNLISDQLTTADADTTVNKSYVKEVIIIGGVNDYRDNSSIVPADLRSAITSVISSAKTMYPNAHVRYLLNAPLDGYPQDFYLSMMRLINTGHDVGSCLPPVYAVTPAYESDKLHLNDTGNRMLATYLLNKEVMPWDITEAITLTSDNANVTTSNLSVIKKPHSVQMRFVATSTEAAQNATLSIATNPALKEMLFFNMNSAITFYATDVRGSFSGSKTLALRNLPATDTYITIQCELPW